MKKLSCVFAALAAIFLLLSSKVDAQYGQYGQPTPSQSILIDKMVGRPDSSTTKGGLTNVEYVDNLTPSDTRFKPNQDVYFRLKVKNTSNIGQTNVTVRDYFPSYVSPVEGPGSYDDNSRMITFNAGNFSPDEEKVYFIRVRLVGQNLMPADKGLFCLINRATASNDNVSDEDTSQFCVEKQVTDVVKVPQAGPEMGVLLMGGEMAMLGLGLYLKKKSIVN